MCLCGLLPRIATRTEIAILQHPRERDHPFGTARLLALALPSARIAVAHGGWSGDLCLPLDLPKGAALLYPHPQATDLAALPPAERPATLVVLDGTWAHARRLYRHNPWLSALRHVCIRPSAPGRYRIRREPHPHCLSTLEAVVEALRILEPGAPDLDRLLAAFEGMVDRQLAHLDVAVPHGRHKRPRRRPSRRLPERLADPDLLIAYAESSRPGGDPTAPRELVQWCAVHLRSGAVFEALLRPAGGLPAAAHLRHMGLDAGELRAGLPLAEARRAFGRFAGSSAPVAAWSPSMFTFAAPLLEADREQLCLKAAWCNVRNRRPGVLEEVVRREELTPVPVAVQGRARTRLGNAVAIARWLLGARALAGAAPP